MFLALPFLGVFIASASDALFPADWLLENALVFVFVAALGALLAMLITAGINACSQADFVREWVNSLRIKRREP